MLEAYVIRKGLGWRAGIIGRHAGETVRLGFDFFWGEIVPTQQAANLLALELKLHTDVELAPAMIKRLTKAQTFREAIHAR